MSTSTPENDQSQLPDLGDPSVVTDDQWRERLTPQEYHVLREGGTEPAFTGEYTDNKAAGTYSCRACGTKLFTSDTKFDSQCGWPSFYQPLAKDSDGLH